MISAELFVGARAIRDLLGSVLCGVVQAQKALRTTGIFECASSSERRDLAESRVWLGYRPLLVNFRSADVQAWGRSGKPKLRRADVEVTISGLVD